MDAKSSAEYAARRVINRLNAYRVEAGLHKEDGEVTEYFVTPGFIIQPRVIYKRNYQCREWAVVRVDNPTLRAASEAGLTNPLSVAWEMTPFSWVADYFLKIGGFLSSFTALEGLTVLDSGRWWRRTDSGVSLTGTATDEVGEFQTKFAVTRYARNSGLWKPSLSSYFTPSVQGLNLNRLTTLAALIKQLSPR
jgi:hypothetical protein